MPTNPTIGLKSVGYFKLITNDDGVIVPSYSAFTKINDAINAKITPKTTSEIQWADDGPVDIIQNLGEVTVEFELRDIQLAVQADLLGHTYSGGVLIKKSTDIAPFIALAFKCLKADRKNYRYMALYKGKFELIESTSETITDKTKAQSLKLKGTFVKRLFDDQWEKTADSDDAAFVTSVGTNWFSYVDNPSDIVPPTVSSINPANNATAVVATSNVIWTMSEAIKNINTNNFILVKSTDGSIVTTTVTWDTTGTIITLHPTTSLSAATTYYAIANTNITDLNNNAMVAVSSTKFTTA
jgi:phi13 family phage major tail protein